MGLLLPYPYASPVRLTNGSTLTKRPNVGSRYLALRISVLASRPGRAVVVDEAREQPKRARRRRADRHLEDDGPRKIADACFWAADAGNMLVDLAVNEVDDVGDMAVVVMSSRIAVAISREVSRSTSRRGCDRPPVVVTRVVRVVVAVVCRVVCRVPALSARRA
jgi:hypothetical protein